MRGNRRKNAEKEKQRKSPERKCQSQPLDSQRLRSLECAPGCPPPRNLSLKGLIYSTRRGRRSRRSEQSTGARRGAEDSGAIVTARAALGALYSPDPPTALRHSPQPRPPLFSSIHFTTPTKWPWSPQGLDRVLGLDITSSTVVGMGMELPAAESWDLTITTTTSTISSSNYIHSSSTVPVAHRLELTATTRRTSLEPQEVTPLPAFRGCLRFPERTASRRQEPLAGPTTATPIMHTERRAIRVRKAPVQSARGCPVSLSWNS